MLGVILHKDEILSDLRRQMKVGLSQDVLLSSQDDPKQVGHFVAALHGQDKEGKAPKTLAGSAKRDVWWSAESEHLPRSCAGLIQTYIDKTATTLRLNTLAAYPAHVVWLNFTGEER